MSSTPNEPATPQQPGQNQPSSAPQYGANPSAPQYGAPQTEASQTGAPQYGAPPAYGSQPGPAGPGYPGAPQWPGESPYSGGQTSVARPQKVEISFWLIIAAGVLNLIGAILGAMFISDTAQYRDLVRQMEQSGGSADSLRSMVTLMAIVFGVVQLALYLLVAFFVRKGANWARILGTVFAALSLMGLFGGNVVNIIVVVMGVAAIVLLYLKDTSPYFAKRPKF
ncbi:hypothetical protein [Arthrobacter woluwensis]|uniref:hypothetical protein n=1 Tax=Arthrobacter woluwensis TaxID=156980 RepID=UPI001AAFB488|nr:hypothetical protein [Arthrobacter woluwensis]QTF72510.1 hypothetical protein G8758_11170 [Arthrobacter woluwensis]